MAPTLILGVALALAGSVALNGSYLAQHAATVGTPAITLRRPLVTVRGLLGSRLWLAGATAGIAGQLLHIAALSHAPLSLVQAFSAGGLALVAPVAARLAGRPLRAPARWGTVVMAAALALLAIGVPNVGGHESAHGPPLTAFVIIVVAAAGLAVARSRGPHALSAAAGMLYGLGDVAIKGATSAAHEGWLQVAVVPWAALFGAVSVLAFFCLQRGLQLGRAVSVVALMTAATNVIAVAGGVIAFAEPLGPSAAYAVLHAVALAAIVVAGWWLALAQGSLFDSSNAPPS